jgi:hypothetical protein
VLLLFVVVGPFITVVSQVSGRFVLGSLRDDWFAANIPPEEEKDVKMAISPARAKQIRKELF